MNRISDGVCIKSHIIYFISCRGPQKTFGNFFCALEFAQARVFYFVKKAHELRLNPRFRTHPPFWLFVNQKNQNGGKMNVKNQSAELLPAL